MTEAPPAERIFETYLKDVPERTRPLVRSLVVSRIAAYQEKPYDPKVGETWMINSELLDQYANQPDKYSVLKQAVSLITLSKHQDGQTEWYYRWLRGNGLSILFDKKMGEALLEFTDDEEESPGLIEALNSFLDTDVSGLDKKALSDVPEAYSLFATFLVCDNLLKEGRKNPYVSPGWSLDVKELLIKAEKRAVNPEVRRVMNIFGEISDTKPLHERFAMFASSASLWLSSDRNPLP